jgi:hypothetical protein
MTLLLRTQRRQEEIEGRPHIIDWQDDDHAVADGETRVGRICREKLPAGAKWCWFLQTAPVAPPPNSGSADTLDEAKVAFRARYEAVQAQWRRS